MGPIQPLGFNGPGWLDRPGSIGNSNASGAGAAVGGLNASLASSTLSSSAVSMNSAVSSLGINNSVSQMLRAIGGGLENNKMLEMMIALMIIMAMLDQQRQGGGVSALDALGRLGAGGSGATNTVQFSFSSYSSTSISLEYSTISLTSSAAETFAAISQPGNADGSTGQRFDLLA